MDSDYIQHVRYKLQKRLKRLNVAEHRSFHWTLVQTWGFLQKNEITKGILDDLERRFPSSEQDADRTLAGQVQVGETESENDAIGYWVIKKCALSRDPFIEGNLGLVLSQQRGADAWIEAFRSNYIEPLFDYIDEQVDDARMTLVLLKKFKHRCEWFHRSDLFGAFKDDTGRGEKALA